MILNLKTIFIIINVITSSADSFNPINESTILSFLSWCKVRL